VTQALRALEVQRGAAAAAMAAARGREEARRAAVVDAVAPLQAGAAVAEIPLHFYSVHLRF
jgi:hypothetical protein